MELCLNKNVILLNVDDVACVVLLIPLPELVSEERGSQCTETEPVLEGQPFTSWEFVGLGRMHMNLWICM